MYIKTTYTQARANLASLCDRVVADQEVVIIERRKAQPVALIDAAELSALMETAHLMRSPTNAKRLATALERARAETVEPQSVDSLKKEMGLD